MRRNPSQSKRPTSNAAHSEPPLPSPIKNNATSFRKACARMPIPAADVYQRYPEAARMAGRSGMRE